MFAAAGHFLRLFKIARTLARHDALFPLDLLAVPKALATALKLLTVFNRRHVNAAIPPGERLAHALEELGPTFIKLGQALATRPDIAGDDVAEALTRLQDRLPPFPGAEARAIIAAELGQPVDALFPAATAFTTHSSWSPTGSGLYMTCISSRAMSESYVSASRPWRSAATCRRSSGSPG